MAAPLLIPGLLAVTPDNPYGPGPATLQLGPVAGIGGWLDIADWKEERWWVRREGAQRLGTPLRAAGLDLAQAPRLKERLGRVRWVPVREEDGSRLAIAGADAVMLAFHRTVGGGQLQLWQGGGPRGFSFPETHSLYAAAGFEEGREPGVERLLDAALLALSGGGVGCADLAAGLWAEGLTQDRVDASERHFAEVAAQFGADLEAAEAILQAVAGASGDAVEVPRFGVLQARRWPGFVLRAGASPDVRVEGGPIAVPERCEWVAREVEPIVTEAQRAERARLEAERNKPLNRLKRFFGFY